MREVDFTSDHFDNPVTTSGMLPGPEDVDMNTETWILGSSREVVGKGGWETLAQ